MGTGHLVSDALNIENCCPSKVRFRANVIAYLFTLARKLTFNGQQLYIPNEFLFLLQY